MKNIWIILKKILFIGFMINTHSVLVSQDVEKEITKYIVRTPTKGDTVCPSEGMRVKTDTSGVRIIYFCSDFCSEPPDSIIKRVGKDVVFDTKNILSDSLDFIRTLYDTITVYVNDEKWCTFQPLSCLFYGSAEDRGGVYIMCKEGKPPTITIEYKYKQGNLFIKERIKFIYLCEYPILNIYRRYGRTICSECLEHAYYKLSYDFCIWPDG